MTTQSQPYAKEKVELGRWPVAALPGASIYGLIAVQALLGAWGTRERNAFINEGRVAAARSWSDVSRRGTSSAFEHFFQLGPGEVLSACELKRWVPKSLTGC